MSGRDSFQPYPETRFASMDRKRAVFAQHTPRQNHLLAALPLEDYERLLPDLEPVALPRGWTVHGAGDREKYLYFLTAGIVSRVYVMESGASAHLAVTGSEGVIGVASFLGGEGTLDGVKQHGRVNDIHLGRLDGDECRCLVGHRWLLLLMVVVEGLTPVMSLAKPICLIFEQIRRSTGSQSSSPPTLGADFCCVARR